MNRIEELRCALPLEQFWAMFTRLKKIKYGETLEIGSTPFKVDSEMVFNALQKELCAQSRIGLS